MKDIIGKVFAYDIANTTKQKEDGTYFVKVLVKEKGWFKSIYKVISVDNGEVFSCPESLLGAEVNNDKEIFIRYPKNIPVFTPVDLVIINSLVASVEEDKEELGDMYNDICKLQSKIQYYSILNQ